MADQVSASPRRSDRSDSSCVAADLTPADRILQASTQVAAGIFRAKPTDQVFSGSSNLSCYYLVFPRTTSEIALDRGPRSVIGPTNVALYRPGDSYRRYLVSREGDRSDYIAVTQAFVDEAAKILHGEEAADPQRMGRKFSVFSSTQSSRVFVRQRQFFEALGASARIPNSDTATLDPLRFEEQALWILAEVMAVTDTEPHTWKTLTTTQREMAEEAMRLITNSAHERMSLEMLAGCLCVSVGHLARTFRQHTGYSIHAYQMQVRLRDSFDILMQMRGNISAVAAHLGFTHHSHFTSAFRKSFGVTPSRFLSNCARSTAVGRRSVIASTRQVRR